MRFSRTSGKMIDAGSLKPVGVWIPFDGNTPPNKRTAEWIGRFGIQLGNAPSCFSIPVRLHVRWFGGWIDA
jgi:hypothetical protein